MAAWTYGLISVDTENWDIRTYPRRLIQRELKSSVVVTVFVVLLLLLKGRYQDSGQGHVAPHVEGGAGHAEDATEL